MHKSLSALLCSLLFVPAFAVSAAGCAGNVIVRTDLTVARLAPSMRTAPVAQSLQLSARPVQFGQFEGNGDDARGEVIPVAVRVPQGVPYVAAFVPLADAPSLVGSDIYPTFDRRTVPLLPYGTFWVEVANNTSAPSVVQPDDVRLVMGDRVVRPLSDSGAMAGRWRRTLASMKGYRVGAPELGPLIGDLHRKLYTLDRAITIAPGETWRGYVVFDTQAFTADEYNAMLFAAGTVEVQLVSANAPPSTVKFATKASALPVLCLPKGAAHDFLHCEALVAKTP